MTRARNQRASRYTCPASQQGATRLRGPWGGLVGLQGVAAGSRARQGPATRRCSPTPKGGQTGAARHLSLLLLLELSASGLELPGCRGFWLGETRLLLPFPHRWGKKGPEPTAPTIPEPVEGTGASARRFHSPAHGVTGSQCSPFLPFPPLRKDVHNSHRSFHSPAVGLPAPGAPCSFHSLVRGRTGARRPPLLPFLRRWCYPPGARCSFRAHGGTRCRSPHPWLPQVQCWWRPEEA